MKWSAFHFKILGRELTKAQHFLTGKNASIVIEIVILLSIGLRGKNPFIYKIIKTKTRYVTLMYKWLIHFQI